jgi:hypothetical protein
MIGWQISCPRQSYFMSNKETEGLDLKKENLNRFSVEKEYLTTEIDGQGYNSKEKGAQF